jgi:hypothetical protein
LLHAWCYMLWISRIIPKILWAFRLTPGYHLGTLAEKQVIHSSPVTLLQSILPSHVPAADRWPF